MRIIGQLKKQIPSSRYGSANFALLLCLFLTSDDVSAVEPVDVGTKAQLFVDQLLVHEQQNLSFTQHPGTPHPQNPLIKTEHPWEGWRIQLYGSVLFDEQEQLFKMWYLGIPSEEKQEFNTCYATSKDGITWEKPLIGKYLANSSQPNNVVLNCLLPSVRKDLEEPDPNKRYKLIGWFNEPKPVGGPHLYTSPDGLAWTRLSEKPICRSSDVITAYFDRQRKHYVAFPKLSTQVRGHVRRCFGLSISKNFTDWSDPYYVFRPDLRDDAGSLARIEQARPMLDVPDDFSLMRTEFYGIGIYQAESCVLGFPWVFTINNNARYGNHEGPLEFQLAVTRDLKTWKRPFRTPVLPRGNEDTWDCGFVSTAAQAIDYRDEVRLYYGGTNYTHGNPCIYREEGTGRGTKYTGGIGLLTWKKDRFVSVDAPPSGGTLKTVPFTFSGQRLEINAVTTLDGQIVVHLCNAQGKTLATSKPFVGDQLRGKIGFSNSQQLSEWIGKPVCLRFEMRSAELYSFAFRDMASDR